MRFGLLHKVVSYLMVLSAYLALATSGEVDPATLLVGSAGIAASWFWESPRVRPERWSPWWNAASLVLFIVTGVQVLSGADVVLAVTRFLLFLLVAKLFSRTRARDYLWCYVLSFALLTAATTLNGTLAFGLSFLGFVVFTTWALILFHLRREMEDNFLVRHTDAGSEEREVARMLGSRRIVGRRFLVATSMASLVIFFASTLLFFMFPRVGFGLFFQKRREGPTMAGFSDQVELGGHGLIRTDSTVVMRVTSPSPVLRSPMARDIHWRGVAFDRYQDGRWGRDRDAAKSRAYKTSVGGARRMYMPGLIDGLTGVPTAELDRQALARKAETSFEQEIYLEPLESTVLFGASMPVAFQVPASLTAFGRSYPYPGLNDEARFAHSAGIKYTVYSDLEEPPAHALSASAPADPQRMARYLQIPDEVPARVRELAERIVAEAGATTPYARTRAIHAYLQTEYDYTLQQQSDPGREPLDYFLFDRKKGHCEYFSSGMAILLRAVGVPTRNVNGFLGGDWNPYGDYFAVRQGDAHSWVEVWFEGVGWITFDPTPPGAIVPRGAQGQSIAEKLQQVVDSMRMKWFKWVIEYDLARQVDMFQDMGSAFRKGSGEATRTTRDVSAFFARHRGTLVAVALGGLAVFLVWFGVRRVRDGSAAGARRDGPQHAVGRTYLRVQKQLARRGFARPPAATPREHAETLAGSGAPGADSFVALTRLYYAAEYGQASRLGRTPATDEAERLARDILTALEQAPPRPQRRM